MKIHGDLCGPTGPCRISVKASPDSRVRSPVKASSLPITPALAAEGFRMKWFSPLTYFSRHLLFPPTLLVA